MATNFALKLALRRRGIDAVFARASRVTSEIAFVFQHAPIFAANSPVILGIAADCNVSPATMTTIFAEADAIDTEFSTAGGV